MQLSLIVAATRNWVIGKENQMPWHLPADLAWFRQNTSGKPVMLIGGGELFKQYLAQADKLYFTQIQAEIDGDTFFPEIHWADWDITFEQYRPADENNAYDCRFMICERKGKPQV